MTDLNTNFTDCDLHIPYKDWSGDPHEFQNYTEMERWAHNFRTSCLPTSTGSVGVIHRAYYFVTSFMHTSGGATSVVSSVAGDGTSYCTHWASATPEDVIDGSVFVPDTTSDASFSLLRVTAPGLLTWNGYIRYDLVSAGAVQFDFFDDHGLTSLEQFGAMGAITPSGPAVTMVFGGGQYIPADTWLELIVRQYSGTVGNVTVRVTFTLLEM